MAKKMIIKGVGTFMAKKVAADGKGREVVILGSLQDLRITLNTEIEDIFGGDGLFAIDTITTSKGIEVTATDAKFDLATVELMYGSTVKDDVDSYVWVLNEQQEAKAGINGTTEVITGVGGTTTKDVVVATVNLAFKETIYDEDPGVSIRIKDKNSLLTEVDFEEGEVPAEGEFMFDAVNGVIILNPACKGEDFIINYKRAEKVDMVDLLADEIPFPVHVIHHGSFLQKDGTYAGIETELYACRAQGSFSIDAARATASSSAVSLKMIDPERVDGKLGTIKRFNTNTKV